MTQNLPANYMPGQYQAPQAAPISQGVSNSQPNQLGATPSVSYYPNTTNNGNNSPSIAGTGMYSPGNININQGAFTNPVGQQAAGQLGAELNNFLPATTGMVQAGQAGYGNQGIYNQGIAGQNALAQRYGQMANGQGPSLATLTAQQAGAANLAGTESMLGSTRGAGNPAAAQLAARTAQAQNGQQIAQNEVSGRTQEELGALGAQGSLYGNIAQQGLGEQNLQAGVNMANTSQGNQVALANQANQLASNQAYTNALTQQNAQQQAGQQAGQTLQAGTQLGQEQIQSQAYNNAATRNQNLFNTGIGAAAGGLSGLFGALL